MAHRCWVHKHSTIKAGGLTWATSGLFPQHAFKQCSRVSSQLANQNVAPQPQIRGFTFHYHCCLSLSQRWVDRCRNVSGITGTALAMFPCQTFLSRQCRAICLSWTPLQQINSTYAVQPFLSDEFANALQGSRLCIQSTHKLHHRAKEIQHCSGAELQGATAADHETALLTSLTHKALDCHALPFRNLHRNQCWPCMFTSAAKPARHQS